MTPSIIDIDISQAEQIISSGIDQQMQFNVTCNFRGQPAFEEGVWLDVTADDLDEDGNIGDLMGDFRIECTPGQVQHITEWLNKYAPTRAATGGSFVGKIVEKTKTFLGNNENPDGDKALLDMGIGIIGLNSLSNYQKKIILEPINNPDYFFSKIYNPSTKLYTSKKQSKFSAFMGNRDKTSAFDDWKIAMEKAEIPHRIIGKAINVANDKILLSGGINPDLLIGYQKETVLEPIKKPWLYFSNSAYSTKSKQFALNDWIADMRKSDIPSDIVKKAIALNKDYNTGDVVELSEIATGGKMDFSLSEQKKWTENQSKVYDHYVNHCNSLVDLEEDLKKAKKRKDTDEIKRLERKKMGLKHSIQFIEENFHNEKATGGEIGLEKYHALVAELEKKGVPCRVKLTDREIVVETGRDSPKGLVHKVADAAEKVGIERNILVLCAETSERGIKSTSIAGGPKDYYRGQKIGGATRNKKNLSGFMRNWDFNHPTGRYANGGRMNTESVTIKPFIYNGWSSAKNKPTVWVDTQYAHPDSQKSMIWGYSAQVGDVSDFRSLFEAAGPGVVLEYNVPSAAQAKSVRSKTIRDYVATNPNAQFAKGGSLSEEEQYEALTDLGYSDEEIASFQIQDGLMEEIIENQVSSSDFEDVYEIDGDTAVKRQKGGAVGQKYAVIYFADKKPIKKRGYDSAVRAFSDYENEGSVYAELFDRDFLLSSYPARKGGVGSMKIISGGITYTVKVEQKDTGSNYNMFASIYKGSEKTPLVGTSFKQTDTTKEVLEWAKEKIAEFSGSKLTTFNEHVNNAQFAKGGNMDWETELKFVGVRNPSLRFSVFKSRDGKITRIENNRSIRFPFQVGQILNMSVKTWACNNHFTINGINQCPEEKIFGIRKRDIPAGHELRNLYPGKFKTGGTASARDKNGLLYALQEFVSAGTVASNTSATTYDQVAEIRAKAIDMLRENGDQPYSLSALVSLLKRAENALVPSDEMMVGLIEKHNQQEWRKRLGGGNLLVGNDILGNKIQNTYRELSSAFELWELWNTSQRLHFLQDHRDKYGLDYELPELNNQAIAHLSFDDLPAIVQKMVDEHRLEGQYAKGGLPHPAGCVIDEDGVDHFAAARTRGLDSVDYEQEAKEYAGKHWNTMTAKERSDLIEEMKYNRFATGGNLAAKAFEIGEIVWDSEHKGYGVVLDVFDDGDVRLDSDGVVSDTYLHKLGSDEDSGEKIDLIQAMLRHKRLVDNYPDRYGRINYAKGGKPGEVTKAIMQDGEIYTGASYYDIISNQDLNFFRKDNSERGYVDSKGEFHSNEDNFAKGGKAGDKTELLAKKFSKQLLKTIGREKLLIAAEANKRESDKNICHSHDYCDANVAMEAALKEMGMTVSNKNYPLINAAWDKAKANSFYTKRIPKSHREYAKEVDAYKWFVCDLSKKEVLSGFEEKSDALDLAKDFDKPDVVVVISERGLARAGFENPKEKWKIYATGGQLDEQFGEITTMYYKIPDTKSLEYYLNFLIGLKEYASKVKVFSAGIGEEYLIVTGRYDKHSAMHPWVSSNDFDNFITEKYNRAKRLSAKPNPEQRWNGSWKDISERIKQIQEALKDEFATGGILSEDMQMAKSDVMKLDEYAKKISDSIKPNQEVEAWVISKISKVEQTTANVKHTLESQYPKLFASGGQVEHTDGNNVRMMCLHIGKYAKSLLKAIDNGVVFESWMKHELSIAGNTIDSVFHYLDYSNSGNHLAKGGGVRTEIQKTTVLATKDKNKAEVALRRMSKMRTQSKFEIIEVEYDWGTDYRVIETYEGRTNKKVAIEDWVEENAETLLKHYLPGVNYSQMFSGTQLKKIGDYCIEKETAGDRSPQAFIDICFGSRFEKAEDELVKDYDAYIQFAKNLTENTPFTVQALSSKDDNTIMLLFTNQGEIEAIFFSDFAKGGGV